MSNGRKWYGNPLEQLPETVEVPPDGDYQDDGHGRAAKHQQFSVKLIWPGKGKAQRATYVQYAFFCTNVEFEQDNELNGTIQWDFANEKGRFRVTITGHDLEMVSDHLGEGRRVSIRVQPGKIDGIRVEKVEDESGD